MSLYLGYDQFFLEEGSLPEPELFKPLAECPESMQQALWQFFKSLPEAEGQSLNSRKLQKAFRDFFSELRFFVYCGDAPLNELPEVYRAAQSHYIAEFVWLNEALQVADEITTTATALANTEV